ncbi:hypothetical protein FRC18_004230 [Serendipita sp. 400]|nr:hypothetical protein FRC18_004230 [Serendipita sp. 400]
MAVYDDEGEVEVPVTLELPYIYDPGNGPRVKDFLAFMRSRYAAPQAQSFAAVGEVEEGGIKDSPRDARWDASRVLPILSRLLPGELATALWYNRTRSTHRVCPTCQRVYNVGDTLRAHVQGIDEPSVDTEQGHQQRLNEQYLSGICSVTCFALATYNFGHAAVLAYSLSWRQLGPATQKVLEGHGSGVEDQGLSYYVRLSRCSGKELSELIGV